MSAIELYRLTGEWEYAVDVVYTEDGGLRVIMNWDLALKKTRTISPVNLIGGLSLNLCIRSYKP